MRGLLIFVLLFALGGSLLGQLLSRSIANAPAPGGILITDRDDKSVRAAELKVRNAPQFSSQDGAIELARQGDGHFYADVRVNGSLVHMLVDTGSSAIALSRDDARAVGLATSIGMNEVVGEGADGAIHGEFVRLDNVELGPLSAKGLEAVVLGSGHQSLLGQSFLSKFESVEIKGDRMVLR